MSGDRSGEPISVVGLVGEPFGPGARAALSSASVVVGSARQLEHFGPDQRGVERIPLSGPLSATFATMEQRLAAGAAVCVLASGDPGFFGIVGALGDHFGRDRLVVHPAPSSISLAFARIGVPWDDADVVSAHGRPLDDAVSLIGGPKVAVLTSPENRPEDVGAALVGRGRSGDDVLVASRIGEADEAIVRTDLEGLAGGHFDPMSVVLLVARDGQAHRARLSWGLPEDAFEHRQGMITKSEVRAVALGKLALPVHGVLWDLGAGSGSVAVECARLRPLLRVVAVERRPDDAERIALNAAAHRVTVEVVCGEAPDALRELPDPHRVFVGGGGLEVLDAALARLRPDGVVVASFTLMERAAAAQARLGNLVQVSVARGVATGALGTRLSAQNPVFLCWGPDVSLGVTEPGGISRAVRPGPCG